MTRQICVSELISLVVLTYTVRVVDQAGLHYVGSYHHSFILPAPRFSHGHLFRVHFRTTLALLLVCTP